MIAVQVLGSSRSHFLTVTAPAQVQAISHLEGRSCLLKGRLRSVEADRHSFWAQLLKLWTDHVPPLAETLSSQLWTDICITQVADLLCVVCLLTPVGAATLLRLVLRLPHLQRGAWNAEGAHKRVWNE